MSQVLSGYVPVSASLVHPDLIIKAAYMGLMLLESSSKIYWTDLKALNQCKSVWDFFLLLVKLVPFNSE